MYKIEPKQIENAEKIGVKIRPSSRKNKKIDVFTVSGNYITSIGDRQYLDFYKYFKIDPLLATQRRKLYLKRHGKKKKGSTGYYANKILWGA